MDSGRAAKYLLTVFLASIDLYGQGNPSQEPCAIQVACKARIPIGEGYVTGTEIIEASIEVREIVRGEKAWELVYGASASNKPPDPGMQYLAARIRFELGPKNSLGDLTFGIRDEQFASISAEGKQYARPSVVTPKPELVGRLYTGESLEGWLVFLVSAGDSKPLMSFGNNYNRSWFKLH